MARHRFSPEHLERLRSPQRLAALDIDQVVAWSVEGLAAGSALDVGTGTGIFAEHFASLGLRVAGVDTSPLMIDAARQHVPQGEFSAGPAEALPYPDQSFDLVFLGLVLHESDDPLIALQEARRVGRLRVAILEWPYEAGEVGPPLAERLPEQTVEALARQAGLGRFESRRLRHVVVYRAAVMPPL